MKKKEVLFGIMILITILTVAMNPLVTALFGPFETSDQELTARLIIRLIELALTASFPVLVLTSLNVSKYLKQFAIGMLAFTGLKIIFNGIRYLYLSSSQDFAFDGLAMPLVLFSLIMFAFGLVSVYLIIQLIAVFKKDVVKGQNADVVKVVLSIVVIEYIYNLPVFNLLRTRIFNAINIQYLINYSRVIQLVPMIINLLLALTLYVLALQEERGNLKE